MASTQKKGNSRKKTPAPPPPPAYNAAARMAGGIVCALLALCVLVSYFGVQAFFLTLLEKLLKGLTGYGYWLWAAALAVVGVVLVGHGGRPVCLRVTGTLAIPVLSGSLLHLLLFGGFHFLGDSLRGRCLGHRFRTHHVFLVGRHLHIQVLRQVFKILGQVIFPLRPFLILESHEEECECEKQSNEEEGKPLVLQLCIICFFYFHFSIVINLT